MKISSVRVEKFKRIDSAEITIGDVTVLIGGNNSGKSSTLQGIHLSITMLQSARSAAISSSRPASTLSFDQLIFKPSNDPMALHYGSNMSQRTGPEFSFTYLIDGSSEFSEFGLSMRRGKNANISVNFDHTSPFYERASDRTRPLSIFVPGIAGVTLREERRTDAIVTTGIAQGDANLYLRNVLLRIALDENKLEKFHDTIGAIFPRLKIISNFDEKIHQFIEIFVEIDGESVPLELVGTGALQAMQLVAYATMYDPALLLLDEPDAHLHPSNQRILAATLLRIAELGSTKIVLATHSRHIFDALARSSLTDIVWLKKGAPQDKESSEDLSILLDLGALDSYELIRSGKCRVIVLTEDTKTDRLKILLNYNGFVEGEYLIQTFNGLSNIGMCSVVAEFFLKQGSDTFVLVHRDSDCLVPDEIEWIRSRANNRMPDRCEIFFTPLTDIEHQFCSPEHISGALGISMPEAEGLIDAVVSANAARLAMEFAQKRSDLKSKVLRDKEDVPSATDMAQERIGFEQIKGKTLWGLLNRAITALNKNPMHLTTSPTRAFEIAALRTFSARAWAAKEEVGDTTASLLGPMAGLGRE